MNKKGFISTTLIYSFFIVFLMLLLLIVNNLISDRMLLKKIENQVKEDLNNESFASYLINNVSSNVLEHHDSTLTGGAYDNSYRYTGGDYKLSEKGLQTYTSLYSEETSLIKSQVITTLEEYATKKLGYTSLNDYLTEAGVSSVEELLNSRDLSTEAEFLEYLGNPQLYYLAYDAAKTTYGNIINAQLKAREEGYVEATPLNNYVCFGTDANPCPEDNLYRIIGAFDGKVKLIKNLAIDNYAWNDTDTNNLNMQVLDDFVSALPKDEQNKIAFVNWYNGGIGDGLNESFPKSIFQEEITYNKGQNSFVNNRIGLMYVSDYAYASSNYDKVISMNDNWLFNGESMWTFSRDKSIYDYAYYIKDDGSIGTYYMGNIKSFRPTFYLKEFVFLSDGDGTIDNPYRVR